MPDNHPCPGCVAVEAHDLVTAARAALATLPGNHALPGITSWLEQASDALTYLVTVLDEGEEA